MKSHDDKLRVGVVGVGTMGQHHVRIVSQLPDVVFAGFHDSDPGRSDEICRRHECRCYWSLEELLDNVDAITVAAPTSLHTRIGQECLERRIHVLMEKPLSDSVEGAAQLVELSRNSGVVLAVGHVERHNPAVAKMMELLRGRSEEIVSVDARRLTPFDGTRCMDVDVLHDLLIHDVDLALEIVQSPVSRVSAWGRPVFSGLTDVAHTRIEFRSGATAVFWTGKCSPRKVRSITVTTPYRYLAADTLSGTLTVSTAQQLPSVEEGLCLMGEIRTEQIPVPYEEPLRREIEDFISAVRFGKMPLVDGYRAFQAMKALDLVAESIASGKTIEVKDET